MNIGNRNFLSWFSDQLSISVQDGGSAYVSSVLIVTTSNYAYNPSYQWYKDGVAISGEIYDNYVIRSGDEGSAIYVVDSNGDTSNTITVSSFASIWTGLMAQHDFSLNKLGIRGWPDVDDDWENTLYSFQTSEGTGLNGKRSVLVNGTQGSLQLRNDTNGGYWSFCNGSGDLPCSFSLWIKFNALANRRILAKTSTPANTSGEYGIFINSTGYVAFYLMTANETTNYRARRTNAGDLVAGNWYNITVTYDGSGGTTAQNGIRIYINGVRKDTTDVTNGTYTKMTSVTSGSGMYLGNGINGYVNANYAGISVWNRALSAAEATTLYNSGTPLFKRENTSPEYYLLNYQIIGRAGDYWVASDGDNLLYSSDDGQSYYTKAWGTQYSAGLPIHNKAIAFCHVFDDGTVLFCTAAQIYRSTDGLVNISTVTPKKMDGSNFIYHTPSNASRPGAYHWVMNHENKREYLDDGSEIVVWGNYCNNGAGLGLGASPAVLWYTKDKGVTVKNLYMYGQNPNYRDDGTAEGGTTGTLLGDGSNSIIARHVHCATRRHNTYEWWSASGDIGTTREEIHVIKHTYDPLADTWTHSVILQNQDDNTKYKLGGFAFIDSDNFIFTADSTNGAGNPTADNRGVHTTTVANFGTSSTQLYDETGGTGTTSAETTCVGFNRLGGKMITTAYNSSYADSVWVSRGFGLIGLERRIIPNASSSLRPGRIHPVDNNYWNFQVGWLNGPVSLTVFIRAN